MIKMKKGHLIMKGTALELLGEYAQIREKMILNFGSEVLTEVEMLVANEIEKMKGGAKDEDETVTDSEHA